MSYKVYLILRRPTTGYTLRETVDLFNFSLNLTQVARLVEGLQWGMFSIEMAFPVDSSS